MCGLRRLYIVWTLEEYDDLRCDDDEGGGGKGTGWDSKRMEWSSGKDAALIVLRERFDQWTSRATPKAYESVSGDGLTESDNLLHSERKRQSPISHPPHDSGGKMSHPIRSRDRPNEQRVHQCH